MKVPFMNLKDSFSLVYEEIQSRITDIIQNTRFIGGPEIEEFEKGFAQFSRQNFAVGCANGTDAIFLALKALGLQPGDKVLVPANSFIATSEAVTMAGGEVDFIDVDKDFCTMDPGLLESYLQTHSDKPVKAIIPVHLFGQMADMPEIMKIADKYNIPVIEDSAQAHGADFQGKPPGGYGKIATYSFYPGKNLGAFGDAGGITTDSEELYSRCKALVNHGRLPGQKYDHDLEGYNLRLDTIQAAVLSVKLKYLKEWTRTRREKVAFYLDSLKDSRGIKVPAVYRDANPVWHLFVVQVDQRDQVKEFLKEKGISCGIHYPVPIPFLKAYQYKGYKKGDFPVSEKLAASILSLPLWPEISREQQEYVTENLKLAVTKF